MTKQLDINKVIGALTPAQSRLFDNLHLAKRWVTPDDAHEGTLQALVRKGILSHEGGHAWKYHFTDLGKALRAGMEE